MKKKILITGSNGQLGKCLIDEYTNNAKVEFKALNRLDLDITNEAQVQKVFEDFQPNFIINCAAYTAVDKAEEEKELAYKVNEQGPQNLSNAAKKINANLIHISTDYVFDGTSEIAYKEEDKTNPKSVYGASKLAGEKAVENSNANAIVIRTSWVYSEYGKNFFKTMHKLGAERDELNVVADQFGAPTYARDLASAIATIVEQKKDWDQFQTYHFSNLGKISWFTFAQEIMNIAQHNIKINAIPSSEYPTPAARPKFSLLSTNKIVKDFGITIPFWKDSLVNCIKNFKNK